MLSKGPRSPEGPEATRGPMRPALPATRAPWRPGTQETGVPRMTAEAHWGIRGPSDNPGHMNETLTSIFLPSKRFNQCLKKIRGLRGP